MAPTIVITGCTEGSIGYYLAKEFSSRGYDVFATARRPDSTGDLQDCAGVTVLPLDITSKDSIQKLYEDVSSKTNGKLDILYNNAGKMKRIMAIDSTREQAQDTFNTNLFGVIELNSTFADLVIAAKGRFVFTGSCGAIAPVPTLSIYNASKAALHAYINTLRIEMSPFGVEVVNVITGGVKSHIWNSERISKEDSPYASIQEKLDEVNASSAKSSTDPAVYARKVVPAIVRRNPPADIWAGAGASVFWFIDRLNLRWMYRFVFAKMYGLDSLCTSQDKSR
ncbi:hypothetical protein DTO021D3_6351 [Paecilomyces variotii]|nr:hypothetical protein DTO032I3_3719 [Paecilomyces variotii]KAJ9276746.1 hypothetical protein DTO021D3_6351 [Paecilomyces variotii]KAJ9345750.1 hypothetical protein DTO027B6_1710 [Paecilomyces variotii]KAJ9387402.1 hypothetical protein DTO032I4_3266 [Paecilomyces variotii]